MPSFREAFREGRDNIRRARGAPSIPRPDAEQGHAESESADGETPSPAVDLEAALRARDEELAESKRLLTEMTNYAEILQSRVVQLLAGAEAMANVLRLPGVKTFLLQRFHPDKYPDADERQRELLTNSIKSITAAYALAGEIHSPE